MRGMLAPLSPHEEATLLRIGFGTEAALDAWHLRRLLQLDLIEWNGVRWALTTQGRGRYDGIVVSNSAARPAA
jgi:hypothetical protein